MESKSLVRSGRSLYYITGYEPCTEPAGKHKAAIRKPDGLYDRMDSPLLHPQNNVISQITIIWM